MGKRRSRMSRGQANDGGIWKRGGRGAIWLDHNGDVEMSDNRASQYARAKGLTRSRGWKQSKAEADTNLGQTTALLGRRYRRPTKFTGTDPDLVAMGPFNKHQMMAFLSKRYHQSTKLLDLSNLGADPDWVVMGISNNTTTESTLFSEFGHGKAQVHDSSFPQQIILGDHQAYSQFKNRIDFLSLLFSSYERGFALNPESPLE
jgi:hypothetical protein